jgi:hypothetical protein
MYSEQSLAQKGIIAVMAALALGAASSAMAEPRWTRMGPVSGADVARAWVQPAPAEAQVASSAPVAATASEVIALRQQVDDLTQRLASFEEQLNGVEGEEQGTRRYTPIGR